MKVSSRQNLDPWIEIQNYKHPEQRPACCNCSSSEIRIHGNGERKIYKVYYCNQAKSFVSKLAICDAYKPGLKPISSGG